MADKNELKNMVLMFRVSELQLLLGLTSQSRCGRKTELMQRALSMLDRGVSVHVQHKIKELYQRFVTRGSVPPIPSPLPSNHHGSNNMGVSAVNQSCGMPSMQSRNINSVHKGLSELLNQHNGTVTPSNPSPYPEVRFKHLPFYDILAELVRPVSLIPKNASRQQEMKISFCFSEEHLKQISNNREVNPNTNRVDFRVQIQMRFCVLDVSTRQPDCFPNTICAKVNGVVAQLPNLIPTNKPGASPRRPSRPVDITQLCRFSNNISNNLNIAWTVEDNKHYCVVVYLVRKLSSQMLLERLQRGSILKPEHTKKLISEKLTLESDNDLALTSLRISLICPLGKMRMSIPCRSHQCDHLQCFDAITFLQMNERKPTWFCPVCDRNADFNRLIIDGFISEIIRDSKTSTEIELFKDGRWSDQTTDESNEDKNIKIGAVVDDCSNHPPTPHSINTTAPISEEVIDLTGDDDFNYVSVPYEEDNKESLKELKLKMENEMAKKEVKKTTNSTITSFFMPSGTPNSESNNASSGGNGPIRSMPPLPPDSSIPQPIALTMNSRVSSPPPLPPSPPPSQQPILHKNHPPPLPPSISSPSSNPRKRPAPPVSPPPLPKTPPHHYRPTTPPAAHQHHRSPSYPHQPFDLSTNTKNTSSALSHNSTSNNHPATLPPIPPPIFPFPMLPSFLPQSLHPSHPFFASTYEAWASSATDASAASMLDFFSMLNSSLPHDLPIPDYSAAAAAFGALNPFVLSSPPTSFMEYFYRSAAAAAAANLGSSTNVSHSSSSNHESRGSLH